MKAPPNVVHTHAWDLCPPLLAATTALEEAAGDEVALEAVVAPLAGVALPVVKGEVEPEEAAAPMAPVEVLDDAAGARVELSSLALEPVL